MECSGLYISFFILFPPQQSGENIANYIYYRSANVGDRFNLANLAFGKKIAKLK